jgi:hypothetical protein
MGKINNPLLLIGGVPKGGTTYLFNVLSKNDVFIPSNVKETNFFLDRNFPLFNDEFNCFDNSFEEFCSRYYEINKGNRYLLEATPHLIWQKHISQALKERDVKLIFLVRNPVERVFSAFNYSKNNLGLGINLSFNEYVNICLNAPEQKNIFLEKDEFRILFNEIEYGRYYPYLEYWIEEIGKEHIILIKSEEFKKNPQEKVAEIFKWLNINQAVKIPADISSNSTYQIENIQLHRFVKKFYNKYLNFIPIPNFVRKYYLSIQGNKSTEIDDYSEGKERLRVFYEESNKLLLKEFGLFWK